MDDLLKLAIEADDGFERWRRNKTPLSLSDGRQTITSVPDRHRRILHFLLEQET
jgi:hypothetical protein